MNLSFMTLLSTMVISSLILLIQYLFLKLIGKSYYMNTKILMILNFLFIIRMSLPVEFKHTITVPSENILPAIRMFIDTELLLFHGQKITVLHCLLITWIAGAIWKIILIMRKYIALKHLLELEKVAGYFESLDGKKIYKYKIIKSLNSPSIVGIREPIILLPDLHFTSKELDLIIKHELFHISNFDLFVKYAYELLLAIYWWNPVMYLFRRQMSQVIELKTDEKVIESLSELEKVEYISTLAKVQEYQLQGRDLDYATSFCYSNKGQLLQRAEYVLQKEKINFSFWATTVVTIISLLLMTSVTFEPYFIPPEYQGEGFVISPEYAYLIKNENNMYELYLHDQMVIEVTQEIIDRTEELKQLEIRNK